MSEGPRIRRVRVHQYRVQTRDLGVDYNGFNSVYEAGAAREGLGYALAIETDQGVTGEYAGGDGPTYAQVGLFARYLLGRDALRRELIYNDVKRALRKQDRLGLGPVDIALWDIAGKVHHAPIWQLLVPSAGNRSARRDRLNRGERRGRPAAVKTYQDEG